MKFFLKNKFKSVCQVFFALAILVSCNNDNGDGDLTGNWVISTVFDGVSRSGAVSQTIGNFAYVGLGYDGDDYLKDFWEYDIEGGFWIRRPDFPGQGRNLAVSFSIGTNIYVGTGYNGSEELSDFYKYDTTTHTWSQIADFGAGIRRSAIGFGIETAGYVGLGYDGSNDRKDFWKYDPVTNTWEQKFGFGGGKRRDAVSFTIGNTTYVGTGKSNGIDLNDFYGFDHQTETWFRLTDLNEEDDYEVKRSNSVAFTQNGKGYICTGSTASTWEYDPNTDLWEELSQFEGSIRQDAVSISNGTRSFVLLGRSSNLYFDDMYEFFPAEKYDDED